MTEHGIDVCRCGNVIARCRCPGPHTPRVVCQTCERCRRTTPRTDARGIAAVAMAVIDTAAPVIVQRDRSCIHDTPGGCAACTAVAARVRHHADGTEHEIRAPEPPTLGRYITVPRAALDPIRAGLADLEIRRSLEHEAREWRDAAEGHRERAHRAGGDEVARRTYQDRAERAERWRALLAAVVSLAPAAAAQSPHASIVPPADNGQESTP